MQVVTGATGLLGNVLARELTSRGSGPVRALVRPTADRRAIADLDLELVQGDVRDLPSLRRAFAGADTVYHLAGIVSIDRGGLPRLRETNVQGTKNVLAACREAGVRRLVYCSSIHAFVVPPAGSCISEDSPIDPDRAAAAYDRTKAEATLLVLEAARQGLDAVLLFPTAIMGPYDWRPSHTGELVRACVQRRLGAYVDGAYNFVDVRDVAAGLAAAAERGRSGQGYILAGHNVTVRELLHTLESVTGVPAPRLRLPLGLVRGVSVLIPIYYWATRQKPLFTTYSLEVISSGCTMTSEKAERELGYRVRPFTATIDDTVRWFRKQGML
jgi:dihydroflavonol-4-reductase